VSSAAGLVGLPWHAPYSAAKFGLRGVSEVLRFDLRRHKIGVTLVCPGGVDTPIADSVDIAGISKDAMRASPFRERFRSHAKSPEHVAERILEGVVRNKFLVHTSTDIRLLYLAERVTPHLYSAIMSGANRAFAHQLGKLVETDPAGRAAR